MVDPLDDVKKGATRELVRAALDSPDVKQAGRELGQATLILAKFIKNAVLPLAVVNAAIDKGREYYSSGRFENELAEKLVDIPQDKIVAPKASIAVPALQALGYSVDEDELREMYLRLIASAMDNTEPQKAHPAFVDVIRQLTAREAQLLRFVLTDASGVAAVEIRHYTLPQRTWVAHVRHVMALTDKATGLPKEDPALPAIVDNWIRLGLVTADYTVSLATTPQGEGHYQFVHERPEYKRFRDMIPDPSKTEVGFARGIIRRTAFGQRFMHAVGLNMSSS